MPNTRLQELQEELEVRVNSQNDLLELVKTDNVPEGSTERDFTDIEEKKFNSLEKEIELIKSKIELQRKKDAARTENAKMHFIDVRANEESQEKKIQSDYSFLRAIKAKVDGKQLTGVEAEIQQEAENEARSKGMSIEGISLPSFMMGVAKRDLVVGTAATAGNVVATNLGEMVPALRPRMKVIDMGAQVMGGLVGNLNLPIGNALASATWATENATATETTPSTSLLSLTPNRLAAFTDVSKQLLVQSSMDVEGWVRRELSDAIARAVDLAAINGSGASNQPTGILNTSNIGDVAGGTNGLAPTNANIIELETLIATANADVANMGYLTTPGIRGVLKNLALGANNAGFVWNGNGSELNGYRADVSTQVPSTLTKGSSSGVCHAIVFGNWADLIIANWGMVDIIVNPYTKSKEGLVELVVNSFWDVGVKHAGSFSAMQDALV